MKKTPLTEVTEFSRNRSKPKPVGIEFGWPVLTISLTEQHWSVRERNSTIFRNCDWLFFERFEGTKFRVVVRFRARDNLFKNFFCRLIPRACIYVRHCDWNVVRILRFFFFKLFLPGVRWNAQITTKYQSLIDMAQSFSEIKPRVMNIFIPYDFYEFSLLIMRKKTYVCITKKKKYNKFSLESLLYNCFISNHLFVVIIIIVTFR